jgi:aminopeptidase N
MSTTRLIAGGLAVAVTGGACGDGGKGAVIDAAVAPGIDADTRPAPGEDFVRDVLSADLHLDVGTLEGTAVISLAPSTSGAVSFEIGDMVVSGVRDEDGPLLTSLTGSRLDVGVRDDGAPVTLTIDYRFEQNSSFDGYIGNGLSFLWPSFCGNLYPCQSEPDDGLTFRLTVDGIPDGATAVYPQRIDAPAPAYMIAFAYGAYQYEMLGRTDDGTEVGVYYFAGDEADALAGTAHLAASFEWLEETYGRYVFADAVASVQANWPGGGFGGMEHHPLWHVARGSMDDEDTHVHEAAHGWFGNGVRIRCWEDFVLSEGLASYLAARALEATGGPDLWPGYQSRLDFAVANEDTLAWPDGCNQIEILTDPLWSSIPYMKGAFFMRAVEEQVGRTALDASIAGFYQERVGTAAGMQDLIDRIESDTGQDLSPLVDGWLKTLGVPE